MMDKKNKKKDMANIELNTVSRINCKLFLLVSIFILFFSFDSSFATFSLSGSVITQTGIDNDLSGLALIAGVTTSTRGTGTSQYTVYDLNNLGLSITGTLTQNPEQEMILFNNPANPIVDIQSGGVYNFGTDIINNGITRQTVGVGIFVASTDAGCCNPAQAVVNIADGGTWNWKGATLDAGQLPWYASISSIVNITNGVLLVRRDATSDVVQVRQYSDNFYVNGFSFIGNTKGDITFLSRPQQMLNYNPQTTGGAIAFSSSTPNYDVTFRGYSGGDKGNTQDIKLWAGSRPILINSKTGSELIVGNHKSDGDANGYGVALVYQEFDLMIKDLTNNPISDVRFFIRDTNNGNREVYNRETYVVDNTLDNVYTGLSQIDGSISTQNILLAANIANTGDVNGLNTGTYAWDYRGKNNDDSDLFDVHLWSYKYQYQILSDVIMKGIVPVSIDTKLYEDQSISQSDDTIVAAYTEINDLDKLYDRAKLWKIQAANVEYPLISEKLIDVNGASLDLGDYSLIVNSTGASVFEVNTALKEIRIKTDTFMMGNKFKRIEPVSQLFIDPSVLSDLDTSPTIPVNITITGLPTTSGANSLCKFTDISDSSSQIENAIAGEIVFSTLSGKGFQVVCDAIGYDRSPVMSISSGTLGTTQGVSLDLLKDRNGFNLYGLGTPAQKALVTYDDSTNTIYEEYSAGEPIITYNSFVDKIEEIFSSGTGLNYDLDYKFYDGKIKINSGSPLRLSPRPTNTGDPENNFITFIENDINPNSPYLTIGALKIIYPIIDSLSEFDEGRNYTLILDEVKVLNIPLSDADVKKLYTDSLYYIKLNTEVMDFNRTAETLDLKITFPFIAANLPMTYHLYYSEK